MKKAVIFLDDNDEIVLENPKEQLEHFIEKTLKERNAEIVKQFAVLKDYHEKIILADRLLKEKKGQIKIANKKLSESVKELKNLDELKDKIENLINLHQKLKKKYTIMLGFDTEGLETSNMDVIFLKRSLNLVEDNLLNTSWSISEFSDSMRMSRSQLYRKIKALTKMSISEFILSIRLKKAACLLEHNIGTITEIAFKVGFNDSSYFAKSFKRKYLVSPSTYVLHYKNKNQ